MNSGGHNTNTATSDTVLVDRTSGAPASSQRAGAHIDVPDDLAWLTASEAAAEGLPGMPTTKRQVNRFITDSNAATRKRVGRGGGREFHWSSLPREAAAEYLRRYGKPVSALVTVTPAARAGEKDLRAETRLKIVDLAHAYVARSKRTKGRALEAFAELYRARRVRDLAALDYDLEPTADPAQVREWSRVVRNRGAGALIDGRGRPKGTGFFDKPENIAAKNYVIAKAGPNGKLTAPELCEDLENDLGVTVALRTMQKFMAQMRNANPALIKALRNPDQARSHNMPAFGSYDVHAINARWELDATRADVMCRVPHGKGFTTRRMALTAVIDVGTRRAMLLVSDEPSAQSTQALLRRAIIAWGVPTILKTDNGKEFSNRAVKLFCDVAGITLQFSQPFQPQQKPHVERFFGTLNRGLLPGLPGYVGANIVERTAIRSTQSYAHRFGDDAELVKGEALTPAGLQARIDAWCRDDYEQRPHASLQGRGESPANVALLQSDQVRRLPNERALDQLLMPLAGQRNVLKKGISVERRWYIAPELGGIMQQKVMVRRDPYDLSRIFVYYGHQEQFFCIAVDPELSGDSAMHIAIAAKREQRRVINETRDNIRKVHQLFPPGSAADRRLAHLAGEGIALRADASEAMEATQGPALLAAGEAAIAADNHGRPEAPVEPTAEQRAAYEAQVAELTPAAPAPRMEQCDGYERPSFIGDDEGYFDWALAHMAAGNTLDGPDARVFNELKSDSAFQQMRAARGAA